MFNPGDLVKAKTPYGEHFGVVVGWVASQNGKDLSLIHISEPTRPLYISYAVFCLKNNVYPLFLSDVSDPGSTVS